MKPNSTILTLCLFTKDADLAQAFQVFYEDKFEIQITRTEQDLVAFMDSCEGGCHLLVYDADNPTEKDLDLLNRIKQLFPELKILISYVYFDGKRQTEEALASQVDAILYKPFDFGEVDRRLTKLISVDSIA